MKEHPRYGERVSTSLLAAMVVVILLAGTASAGTGDIDGTIARSALTTEEKHDLAARAQAAIRAGVPAEDVGIIVARSLEHGADAAAIGRFLDTASRVSSQDLPVRPVVDRIEQGLSKGIHQERIAAASGRLADGLAKAKPLIDGLMRSGVTGGKDSRDAAIESVARAAEQSVPEDTLRATGEKLSNKRGTIGQFDQAVRSLTLLVGAGMPHEAAARLVQSGVERGFTERDYAWLERSVSDMVRQGRGMDDIVRAAERDMLDHRGAGEGPAGGMRDRDFGGREPGGRGGRGR